mmetsp:Transcript_2632/g.6636  ORF Transcript_2632/g.6636 Transcript_2632/m.6636 type:complete len:267 (-) Transcript_2632:1245-2045(-)
MPWRNAPSHRWVPNGERARNQQPRVYHDLPEEQLRLLLMELRTVLFQELFHQQCSKAVEDDGGKNHQDADHLDAAARVPGKCLLLRLHLGLDVVKRDQGDRNGDERAPLLQGVLLPKEDGAAHAHKGQARLAEDADGAGVQASERHNQKELAEAEAECHRKPAQHRPGLHTAPNLRLPIFAQPDPRRNHREGGTRSNRQTHDEGQHRLHEGKGALDKTLVRRLFLVRPSDENRLDSIQNDEAEDQEAQRLHDPAKQGRPVEAVLRR